MGAGDELMAAGQARALAMKHPGRKVIIYDRNGRTRDNEMWRGNPYIYTRADRPYLPLTLTNGPGCRPYILAKTPERWVWKDFEPFPADLFFDEAELAAAQGPLPGIIVEPNSKAKASPNKNWGVERWQALVDLLLAAGHRVTQIGPADTRLLRGVHHHRTETFRAGCAVLARARAAVLPEGGLHHAAAALGIRAVVIFGGYISPRQTGYASQTSLFTGGEPCGARMPCPHCAEAMARITPQAVFAALEEKLR